MDKYVPIITNQANASEYGGIDNFTVYSSGNYNKSTYPREILNRNNQVGWGSKTGDRLAWVRVLFPHIYALRKFAMSTPNDVVMTKKTPTKFKIYGIRENYRNIHEGYQLKADISITVEPDWAGADLLLDVNEEAGFWSPNQTKEWTINKSSKKYIGFYIYMYGKEEAWTGTMEYFIGEVQMYTCINEKDVALIKRNVDGKYVSIQKNRLHAGLFSVRDLNEERERFYTFKSDRNIRSPFRVYLNKAESFYIFSETTYTKGKWYYEVRVSSGEANYGQATYHMLGWHSKSDIENVVLPYEGDGVYLFCIGGSLYGAIERKVGYQYTKDTSMVDRIGIAVDLDNDYFEVYYDGASQGKVKMRSMGKPLVPVIGCGSSSVGEVALVDNPKYLPKGYKNIVRKRDYEDIIVRFEDAPTVDDYKKYGVKEGESIEFDKPYNKLRVFTEVATNTVNGKIHSFKIVPSTETINKVRIEV
ncbi:hypothetical protein [Brevibacillus laterosporus]|uniref:hypothetical protein n=1 Tax=Brevibacillus laterosporus TaxID=1465 RepID=UPI00215D409E|nr:hypothetical protein [Brevibacillus laterosporus]MCR8994671.1 hypothetical protein [Brevibacillus laterosporus]